MVVGICMVRDEADIIGVTLQNMLAQVDAIIVADNGSTDDTPDILEGFVDTGCVLLHRDRDPAYYQSRKMSLMAEDAVTAFGADWVVPFDADEAWYSPFGRIADVLMDLEDATVATAKLYDHVHTNEDPDEGTPFERMGWRRRDHADLPKVACRPAPRVTIEQGNHGASYPSQVVDGQLVVRHFPYRSPEQMIRKARNGAAAYAATDLPEYIGQHWRDYGRLTDEQITATFFEFFHVDNPSQSSLIFDPCPTAKSSSPGLETARIA